MAFVSISAGDVDAESPLADFLFSEIKYNFDWLKSAITDGASASQVLNILSATLNAVGTALTVNHDALVLGNLEIDGNLITGDFFSSEQLLELTGW